MSKIFTKKNSIIASILLIVLLVPISIYAYMVYAVTPENMRNPVIAHHHFRMQLIIDGEYINFGEDKYQEPYVEGLCDIGLTETPIHFHDGLDQFVHIHWDKITGGQVLKYYGLNLIGGNDNLLGYRIDEGLVPQEVGILGNLLPEPNVGSEMWVYILTDDGEIQEKSSEDFLNQDLETFFGKKSTLTEQREEAARDAFDWRNVNISAYAHGPEGHGGHSHGSKDDMENDMVHDSKPTQEELKVINNLIGDVVIFIQNEEPTNEMVERFDNLVELQESSCGG